MDSDLKAKIFVIASDGATEIYSDYGKNKEIKLICPLQSGTYYIRIECLENYGGYQLQMNSVEIKIWTVNLIIHIKIQLKQKLMKQLMVL